MNNFFLVIPTREREEYLLNLLNDLNSFSEYISQCVIVDQSEKFIGDHFPYEKFTYTIEILKGDSSKGVNHSRNLALSKYNQEEWLFFLDDDLRVKKGELEKIIYYISNYTYDVFVPGINEVRKLSDKKLTYGSILDSLCKPQSFEKTSNRILISSGLSIVSKYYFQKAGNYFDEIFTFWGDDWDFGLRLYKAGATIKYVPDINFTHLKAPFGGQRSYSEKICKRKERKLLEYYLIRKHFGMSVLKERFILDILKNCKSLNFKAAINDIVLYRNMIK